MRSVEDHYWWYRALRRHVLEVIRPPSPAFSLLDAGCGTGGMLRTIRDRFAQAKLAGVEISAHALQLAAARDVDAELRQGSVEELPFATGTFDCVLSLDVITHRGVNDAAALREANRTLRAGGSLIINVAAFDFLKGEHDAAVDVDRRYTRRRLTTLLTGTGFAIEKISHWNMLFFPAVALQRGLSRFRGANAAARSDFRPMPRLLNEVLRRMAQVELRAGDHVCLPFGTSLFAVARKNG